MIVELSDGKSVDIDNIKDVSFYVAKVKAIAKSKLHHDHKDAKKVLKALKIKYPEEFV